MELLADLEDTSQKLARLCKLNVPDVSLVIGLDARLSEKSVCT